MRVWYILWLSFSQHFLAVWAVDGPIDFEKTPTGGPSTLRACAQYAFNPASRAGSVYSLGCETISVGFHCRPGTCGEVMFAEDTVRLSIRSDPTSP